MLIAWQWRRFCYLLRCSKDSTADSVNLKGPKQSLFRICLKCVFCICFANFILVHVQKFQQPPSTANGTSSCPMTKAVSFFSPPRESLDKPCWIYAHQNIKADLVLSQPQHPVFPIKPCNSKAKDISSTEISISFSRSRVLLSCFWACRCRVKRSALTKVSCSILCIQSLSNSEASTLKFRSSTKWKKWRFWYPTQKWRGWCIWRCSFCSANFRVDILWKFLNFCLRKVKSYIIKFLVFGRIVTSTL